MRHPLRSRSPRRRQEFLDHSFEHVELGVFLANPQQGLHHAPSLIGRQAFDIGRAPLGCEDAYPDFLHRRLARPEIHELGNVAATLHHRAGDGAVDRKVMMTLNVAEDALVGGRLAAQVVLWLQAID
jgi:hypothetical protein